MKGVVLGNGSSYLNPLLDSSKKASLASGLPQLSIIALLTGSDSQTCCV
jgi:hypothetical protein